MGRTLGKGRVAQTLLSPAEALNLLANEIQPPLLGLETLHGFRPLNLVEASVDLLLALDAALRQLNLELVLPPLEFSPLVVQGGEVLLDFVYLRGECIDLLVLLGRETGLEGSAKLGPERFCVLLQTLDLGLQMSHSFGLQRKRKKKKKKEKGK